MDYLFTFLGFEALDRHVEKSNNEIKFENFVQQAKEANILTPKDKNSKCVIKRTLLFKEFDYEVDNSTMDIKEAYDDLYKYLVNINVITNNIDKASIITWDNVQTINKDLISIDKLKKLIKEDNQNFTPLLKCYNINIKKLSYLLNNYNYNYTDKIDFWIKGGKIKKINNKTNKKINNKTKRNK